MKYLKLNPSGKIKSLWRGGKHLRLNLTIPFDDDEADNMLKQYGNDVLEVKQGRNNRNTDKPNKPNNGKPDENNELNLEDKETLDEYDTFYNSVTNEDLIRIAAKFGQKEKDINKVKEILRQADIDKLKRVYESLK